MVIEKENWDPQITHRNYAVICPFHKESTPSCIIMPKKGLFHCFGCGVEGYMGEDDSLFTDGDDHGQGII